MTAAPNGLDGHKRIVGGGHRDAARLRHAVSWSGIALRQSSTSSEGGLDVK